MGCAQTLGRATDEVMDAGEYMETKTRTKIEMDERGRVHAASANDLKGLTALIRQEPGYNNNGVCANVGSC